jgi:hypothetical protein
VADFIVFPAEGRKEGRKEGGRKTISSIKNKYNFFSHLNFTQQRGVSKKLFGLKGGNWKKGCLSGKKVTHEAPAASGIRKVEKNNYFLSEHVIFFVKLAFINNK